MTDVSRRDAVKLAAGLAVGAGTLAIQEARGQEAGKPADPQLEQATRNPQAFMFGEQVTFKIEGDGHSRELFITSARDSQGRRARLPVPAGSMRIFRADADLDAFTRQGGLYWQFRDTQGKAQFKQAGALVMIVRDHDDTVRCYTLVPDLRC
jgi:hypothetical protein